MKVNAYLLPLDVVGNHPMVSTGKPAKGTWWISRCIGLVLTLFGKNCTHSLQVLIFLMHVCFPFCLITIYMTLRSNFLNNRINLFLNTSFHLVTNNGFFRCTGKCSHPQQMVLWWKILFFIIFCVRFNLFYFVLFYLFLLCCYTLDVIHIIFYF